MKKVVKRYKLRNEIDEILGLGGFMVIFSMLMVEVLKYIFN